MRAAARRRGDAGGFNLWAGQAHELARNRAAGEIVREIGADAGGCCGSSISGSRNRPGHTTSMTDAELLLRGARRPLVIGMGGGGDVVGALATAEFCRVYDGADPIVGGVTWERRPIDPLRALARRTRSPARRSWPRGSCWPTASTRVRDRDVYFAESRMAQFLGQQTV